MTAAPTPPLALITGGCKRLGAAIAARLAEKGWALALHGHTDAEPDTELSAVLAKQQTEWTGFVADLAFAEDRDRLMSNVTAKFGRAPDLLVNNASLFQFDDWKSLTEEALQSHFQVNMFAPTLLSRQLVELAGEGNQPAIVNIVDQRVRQPNGDQLSYTLSKQALGESIRSLASAFGPRARINGVAPGLTLPTADYSDGQMDNLAKEMPLDRLSQPSDIAEAVLYLANANAVTGQILFVDGGAHMKHFERDFVFMGRD